MIKQLKIFRSHFTEKKINILSDIRLSSTNWLENPENFSGENRNEYLSLELKSMFVQKGNKVYVFCCNLQSVNKSGQ